MRYTLVLIAIFPEWYLYERHGFNVSGSGCFRCFGCSLLSLGNYVFAPVGGFMPAVRYLLAAIWLLLLAAGIQDNLLHLSSVYAVYSLLVVMQPGDVIPFYSLITP